MASLFSPFRSAYRTLQGHAHESPVLFYSVVIGMMGPVILITVPPIRKQLGYKPAEYVPTTYPLPNRPRREVKGYEDE